MKNLRISALMAASILAFSCSSDKNDVVVVPIPVQETLLNTPVAGTIYSQPFAISADGGYASNINSNGIDKVYIYLTSSSIGCDAPDGSEFPVTVLAPVAVGTHTANTAIFFKDPNSTDFVNVTGGITVEIISVGNTVVGRVMGGAGDLENKINGKFEVPYCD